MSDTDFRDYHRATAGRPTRDTVRCALAGFAAEPPRRRQAVDLGCGAGRDALALLAAGFAVYAVDTERSALCALRAAAPAGALLQTVCARMQEVDWPAADLVVASFSLPLMPPAQMLATWHRLRASLRPGGRFAGQFLGDRDSWAVREGVTCLRESEVRALLGGLNIEMFMEEENDSVTPRGSTKHWHLFHVVVGEAATGGAAPVSGQPESPA